MPAFKQVDVFTSVAYRGNPVAVVMDGSGLADQALQQFANWTNLSETTFLLPPTDPAADYRVRIFTPDIELPFAGHPTIGSCHAWLEAGGTPKTPGVVIQECEAGLITLRQDSTSGRLAFAAPPLTRSGPVDEADLEQVCKVLQIDRSDIVAAQWADNGPGWIAVMLADADAVLALQPNFGAAESYDIGVVGAAPLGVVGSGKIGVAGETNSGVSLAGDSDIEVRAFFRSGGQAAEDPVTGSLNAALAQWLLSNGTLTSPYVASQGDALGRAGRVYVEEADDKIWVGGDAVTCIDGTVTI